MAEEGPPLEPKEEEGGIQTSSKESACDTEHIVDIVIERRIPGVVKIAKKKKPCQNVNRW